MHIGEDSEGSWQRIIGFHKIWTVQHNLAFVHNMVFIILKCFIFLFCSLQHEIFNCSAYWKFIDKKVHRIYLGLAEIKAQSYVFLMNNIKLRKISKNQQEKNKIVTLIGTIQDKLKEQDFVKRPHKMETEVPEEKKEAEKDEKEV